VSAACVVLVTVPDEAVAERLAEALLGEQLAACVNLLPGLRSIYRWQGKIERSSEVQLIVKTRESRVDALIERIGVLHPYDTPEILVLPVVAGGARYLAWIRAETSTQSP